MLERFCMHIKFDIMSILQSFSQLNIIEQLCRINFFIFYRFLMFCNHVRSDCVEGRLLYFRWTRYRYVYLSFKATLKHKTCTWWSVAHIFFIIKTIKTHIDLCSFNENGGWRSMIDNFLPRILNKSQVFKSIDLVNNFISV